MKYLEIKNTGLIEPEALTLLGGTTKRNDDTKIGLFGSGNKYALAYFVRNDIDVRIFSGTEEISVGTKTKHFRGMDMKVITINGCDTSITTETGPGWGLWQCIREIYSNAVDEGILSFNLVDDITTESNVTSFYLEANKSVIDFFSNKELYIYSENRILFECSIGRILKKHGEKANIYRKGIRCYDTEINSLYDYDLFDIDINESRLVQRDSEAMQAVWSIISQCENHDIVTNFLQNHASDKFIENNHYLDYWSGDKYNFVQSIVWDSIFNNNNHFVAPYKLGGYVDDIWRKKTFFVQGNLYTKLVSIYGPDVSALKGANGDNIKYKLKEPTPLEKATIEKAKTFFSECGFNIGYSVYVADFLIDEEDNLMGLAHNGNIIISSNSIEKGTQYVVDTMIEEYIHLKHNVCDNSRGFQNAAISELINYMKQINTITL